MTSQTDYDDAIEAHAASVAAADEALFGGDPSKLSHPIKNIEDKYQLLPAFLKVRGLVKQVTMMYDVSSIGHHGYHTSIAMHDTTCGFYALATEVNYSLSDFLKYIFNRSISTASTT